MRTRPTEPQLMLVIILFVVFAFLMQGMAHGEGGLGNGIRPNDSYRVSNTSFTISTEWMYETDYKITPKPGDCVQVKVLKECKEPSR